METNPYQPPLTLQDAAPLRMLAEHQSRRRLLASVFLAATIIGALVFVFATEMKWYDSPPAGIMLIVATTIVSIITALVTRDAMLSPLCCLAGMMAGVALAATMNDWKYVSLEITVPMTFAASLPSFAVAKWLSRRFRIKEEEVARLQEAASET